MELLRISHPENSDKVAGLYMVTPFVVWQLTAYFSFGAFPTTPIIVGGALIMTCGIS
jgi:hypothetical protein